MTLLTAGYAILRIGIASCYTYLIDAESAFPAEKRIVARFADLFILKNREASSFITIVTYWHATKIGLPAALFKLATAETS